MNNKVVRFILNMGPRTHIGQRELDRVGLLSVKDKVIQMKMNHVYKFFSWYCSRLPKCPFYPYYIRPQL